MGFIDFNVTMMPSSGKRFYDPQKKEEFFISKKSKNGQDLRVNQSIKAMRQYYLWLN